MNKSPFTASTSLFGSKDKLKGSPAPDKPEKTPKIRSAEKDKPQRSADKPLSRVSNAKKFLDARKGRKLTKKRSVDKEVSTV